MNLRQIQNQQKQIERGIKLWHPDNPFVLHLQQKYRELETLKQNYETK